MMNQEVLNYVKEKTRELMASPTCNGEAKASAEEWLAALGTEQEEAETKKYVEALKTYIMPVDMLIGFADSDMGAKVFGADKAKQVAAHGRDIKAVGAKYCDCPACAAVEAILEKEDALLGR